MQSYIIEIKYCRFSLFEWGFAGLHCDKGAMQKKKKKNPDMFVIRNGTKKHTSTHARSWGCRSHE